MSRTKLYNQAFTIVELLIVIVVIAILAMIAIVSYRGIQDRAVDSQLQSDLRNGSKVLGLAYASDGVYPTASPTTAASQNTTFQYTRSSTTAYCLTASSSNGKAFHITNNGSIEEGTCAGHTGGGTGGGGGDSEDGLYATLTPEATRLKQYVEALIAAPGQLSDYTIGDMTNPESFDPTPITSFFSGWTTSEFANFLSPSPQILPTDPDGYKLAVMMLPHLGGAVGAYLFHGDAMDDPSLASSVVMLTPSGQLLTPYSATGHDPAVILSSTAAGMQYVSMLLTQSAPALGLAPATMTGQDFIDYGSWGAMFTVASEAPGGPWTIRFDNPENGGFTEEFTNCTVTLEALDAQWIRAKGYSCP